MILVYRNTSIEYYRMETNREMWRSIDGYSNYEVSTHGRVRNATTGSILKARSRKGYLAVDLSLNGVPNTFNIHTLVANEFIDTPQHKPLVDHIDNDKTNNHVSNLRYATRSQNGGNSLKHKFANSIIVQRRDMAQSLFKMVYPYWFRLSK